MEYLVPAGGQGEAICNACGAAGSSKEHYLHVEIGRVILGDRRIPEGEVRRALRAGRLGEFRRSVQGKDERAAFLADAVIGNLICERCNREWANELEVRAGRALFAFLSDDQAANAAVLRKWAWWFGIKTWWLDSRTDALRGGALRPLLSPLAKKGSAVTMNVRVARLDTDPERWLFGSFIHPAASTFEYVIWLLRGTAWIILPREYDGGEPMPFHTRELRPGLRLKEIPLIPRREILALPAVRAVGEG